MEYPQFREYLIDEFIDLNLLDKARAKLRTFSQGKKPLQQYYN